MRMNTKARRRMAVFCAAIFLGVGAPAFSQTVPTLDELTRTMDSFAESMALTLPFNASMGLNWSDAHIGKFFPSFPPSFGLGFLGGFTTMSLAPIDDLFGLFGTEIPDLPFRNLPIPGMMVEMRLGGVFLPFDLGFKLGFLPGGINNILGDNLELDYFVIGGDFRYALVEAGRIVPAVSLGVGFTHLRGGIGVGVEEIPINFEVPSPVPGVPNVPGTLTIYDPHMGINWSTSVLDFKVHVSRPLFIITPYVGLGLSHGWSRVSYHARTDHVGVNAGGYTLDDVSHIFADAGIDVTPTNFSSEIAINGWSVRAFGGLSFNFPFVRLDITGLWNMRDNNLGATVGLRFQL